MGTECERKFMVEGVGWQSEQAEEIRQGYLSFDPQRTVRVRVTRAQAFLTVKGMGEGITRLEYEYEIPHTDGCELLELCVNAIIEKRRHPVRYQGRDWVVDVFSGPNQGLLLAEIELENENEEFPRPPWLGREVTGDPRYTNACLAQYPLPSRDA